MYTKFHFSVKKMNGNCWRTDRQTDSRKAICPPFFKEGHKYAKMTIKPIASRPKFAITFH